MVLADGILMSAVLVWIRSLTFFFGDASAAGRVALEFIINFSICPIGIFPPFIRVLMHTPIPAAFITHIPLALVKSFTFGNAGLIAAGTAAYIAAYAVFRAGLKRDESGNLIITRL